MPDRWSYMDVVSSEAWPFHFTLNTSLSKRCGQYPFIKCIKKAADTGLRLKNMMDSVSPYSSRRMAVNVSSYLLFSRLVFMKRGQSCLERGSSERNSQYAEVVLCAWIGRQAVVAACNMAGLFSACFLVAVTQHAGSSHVIIGGKMETHGN